ncbi:MAG: IS630 family transposase [Chloroflexi bacterium]|nr:IS630 family transposase [Chloroflexota bacterium]
MLRRRAVGRVALRAQMVLWSAQGMSARRIAELLEIGEDVVRTWLQRYQAGGLDGLVDRPRPGRPPKDRLARQIVDAQAGNPPCHSGLVQTCWTVGLLATFLLSRFGLALSPSSVRRHLKASGWRWGRPRLAPATHAPGRQKKVDPAAATKLRLIERALASAATVLYLDECELQLLPIIRACWMKGARLRVPTPGQNAKRAVFGALNARTGQVDWLIQPRKRAVEFVAFLEQLAQAYPAGEVVLVLDNVITHDAKLVRAWLAQPEHARFRLLWLPKYAAHEHNPIERVWGLLKDAVAANRLHGSIEALVAEAERFLATRIFRAPQPIEATAELTVRAA